MATLRRSWRFKGKTPQLLAVAVVSITILVVLGDLLEDTFIGDSTFLGAPFDSLLNAIIMITRNVTATVASLGYVGIFTLMLLESSSLPIPSEVVLPFSGYLVSLGQLDFWWTILFATLAGISGSVIDYYIGMKGIGILSRQKALEKLFFSKANLERTQKWFSKYGTLSVLLSRMIPGFRTLVSFPAGAVKMPLGKFTAYTAAGCLVWNTVLVYVGVYIGSNWREVAGVSHYLILGFLAAILVALAIWVKRRRSNKLLQEH